MTRTKWDEETIRELAESKMESKYLGYEIVTKHDGKRNRRRIYLKFACSKCGNEYKTNIDVVRKGRSALCLNCSQQKMVDETKKHSIEKVVRLFKKNGLYLVDKDYQNNFTPLTAMNEEGYKVYTSYNNLLKGYKGMVFRNDNPHTLENIKLYISRKVKGYQVLSENYISADFEKLAFKCDKGHHFQSTWNDFRNGTRCPICNNSKGERKVAKWLDDRKIDYIREYSFTNCRYKHTLPFDFYLPQHNLCIEYDGKQHYKPIDFFGGIEGYRETKRNDNIKNEYCESNNIKLLRIPYTIEDVGGYLNEKLSILDKPIALTK